MYKKLFSILLAVSLVFALAVCASAESSGSCGENATWSYADGKLTITGTGALYDYQAVVDDTTDAPWSGFAEELTTVVIEDGITSIGQMNFRGLSKLESVTIADSVTYIDHWAFWSCEALEAIDLPDGLTGIGQEAFTLCSGLRSIEIPGSVTFLGGCVFDYCTALTDAYFRSDPNLPSFMTGNSNFRGCSSLEQIRVEEGHLGLRSIDGVLYFYWESGELLLHDYPMGKQDAILQVADGTIEIGQYAVGNPYLKKVTIPDTVTTVSTCAFAGCYGLETVTFEGSAPEIGQGVFEGANLTIRYPAGDASWDARDQWSEEYLVGNGIDVGVTWVVYNPADLFLDVPVGAFYEEPVLWAVETGITNGTTADSFNPNGSCLRAQVVTFLHRAKGNPEPSSTNNPFTDVKTSDFFYKPVLWAVEKGITNGVSATAFGSYDVCNRAVVVTFLWRSAGSPTPSLTEHPFVDIPDGAFYETAVLWALENEITQGISATEFGPTSPCNRAQVVTFLYRAYK